MEYTMKNRNMKGVLLVNLGSPESPTPKDVKPIDQFFDGQVRY
jgi:protoheme ferro-lyase